jgi:2-keto-3-deoxy-L-rhamnonate aldolase RhmA
LLIIGIIETVKGVKNLADILEYEKGIGVIMAGAGDLSVDMGLGGAATEHSDVQDAILEVLKICNRKGVPCATGARNPIEVDKRLEEGFTMLTDMQTKPSAMIDHARKVSG